MIHIDQHTIELYALNAEKVNHLRKEIESHLAECIGCKLLYDEIAGFHKVLKAELEQPPLEQSVNDRHLARMQYPIEPFTGPTASPAAHIPRTPMEKFRYLVRRHPVAAGAGAFFSLSLLGFFLMRGPLRSSERDSNPAYTFLNNSTGMFEVYNIENEKLWNVPLSDAGKKSEIEVGIGARAHQAIDINADGTNEILTTFEFSGSPETKSRGIHIFDSKGEYLKTYRFSEPNVKFRNAFPYTTPTEIRDGAPILIDSEGTSRPKSILTFGDNFHSPSVVLKLDLTGNVIGQYWHFGTLRGCLTNHVGGRNKDLLLFGVNDVDDKDKLSEPVIVVLIPDKISGVSESGVTRGFGHKASGAEEYYIRLPLSDLNIITNVNALVTGVRKNGEFLTFDCTTITKGVVYKFEYVFTSDYHPVEVKPTTPTIQYYYELHQKGIFNRTLDQSYLDSLKGEIRFWDGKEWKNSHTMVSVKSVSQQERPSSRGKEILPY